MQDTRVIAALGAAFLSIGCMAACGGGIPSDAVVQIDGQPITKETFKHWLNVAAAASATTTARPKAVKPVIPEPPAYTACIAHLQAIEPKPDKGQQAKTPAALKAECEQQYESLKQQTLGFLTSLEWVFDEAREKGVEVSDQQVMAHFEELKREQFPKEADSRSSWPTPGRRSRICWCG